MAELSSRQRRNQPQTTLPKPGPGPVSSDCLAEVQAAMGAAGRDNAARQAEAARWMDHGPASPTVSGDRQPTKASHAGHVGDVFGQGVHPAASPPGELWRQPERLPPMPPGPVPVSTSLHRPALTPGWWLATDAKPAGPLGPLYVSIDQPGGRRSRSGGILAAIRRWFKGGGE